MLFIYMLSEIVFLMLIVFLLINSNNNLLLNIFKFMPILLNLIFSFTKKVDIKLRCILLVTVIADICFLFFNNYILGVSIFVLVQIIYYIYFTNKNSILLLICSFINIMLVLIFNKKLVIIESIVYSMLSFINIYKSYKLGKINKYFKLINFTLVFLFICDLSIGVNYLFKLGLLFEIIEWVFYILSQVILIIYCLYRDDAFLYKLLHLIIN